MSIADFRSRSVVIAIFVALASNSAFGQTHGISFGNEKRLEVFPVLFVPSDIAEIPSPLISSTSDSLYAQLEVAQKRYGILLGNDTFKIADGPLHIFYARRPHSYYIELNSPNNKDRPDRADTIISELFAWNHDDRMRSKYIYLVIYARPCLEAGSRWCTGQFGIQERGKGQILGGGRTFNGPPNSGGGFAEMELSALLIDYPYTFQASVVHELGHTFGLSHADCHGYNQETDLSPMAYNLVRRSRGLMESSVPGKFDPEDYFVLSENKLAFPHFQYIEAKHNPERRNMGSIEECYLSPMNSHIGQIKRIHGLGFELYFDGRLVSTLESEFITLTTAKKNCRYNQTHHEHTKVVCLFHGRPMSGLDRPETPPPSPDVGGNAIFEPTPVNWINLAGAWCSSEKPTSVSQSGGALSFHNEHGMISRGHFEGSSTVVADDWYGEECGGEHCLRAVVGANATRLDWTNGAVWQRKANCGS